MTSSLTVILTFTCLILYLYRITNYFHLHLIKAFKSLYGLQSTPLQLYLFTLLPHLTSSRLKIFFFSPWAGFYLHFKGHCIFLFISLQKSLHYLVYWLKTNPITDKVVKSSQEAFTQPLSTHTEPYSLRGTSHHLVSHLQTAFRNKQIFSPHCGKNYAR